MKSSRTLTPFAFAAAALATLCVSSAVGFFSHRVLDASGATGIAAIDHSIQSQSVGTPADSAPSSAEQPVSASQQPVDDLLPTGVHQGEAVKVVSISDRDTDHAAVEVKWPLAKAKLSCERGGDFSEACAVEAVRTTHFPGGTANCRTGAFTSVAGTPYRYEGRASPGSMERGDPEFIIRDNDGHMLDGSAMSGYDGALAIFQLLCPSRR